MSDENPNDQPVDRTPGEGEPVDETPAGEAPADGDKL